MDKMDWTKTKAVWDGEDWRFTEVPLEASAAWRGTTTFSRSELNYNGDDPAKAITALMYWCEHGESQLREDVVDLWYVVGIGGVYYGTKMQAEVEARKAFPNEDAGKRYARVFYKTFYQEV